MDASRTARRRTLIGGGVIASALALSAALGWGGAKSALRVPSPPPDPTDVRVSAGPAIPEQPELADDYDLVDPGARPSAGLDGVITSLSDLTIPITKRTMRYVERFGRDDKGRKTFHDAFRRAGRYRDAIEHELTDAGLPEDLVWVAAIESGFNPQATSPAGATGIFQFMPQTAERFGLTVTDEIDERRSITKSTTAAIAYLKVLYATYGSWDLALAAYNCGEGRLDEAITKGLAIRGRSPSGTIAFHELAEDRLLPSETANYVPQIHAFAIVAHNRELLDLDDLDPLPALDFAEVAVPAATRLAPIAKAAGITVEMLEEYNPDILTDHLPLGHGDYIVNVPAEALDQTIAALPALAARDTDREPPPTPAAMAKRRKAVAAQAPPALVAEVAAKNDGEKPGKKPKPQLTPAPGGKGALFVLSNGVLVDLEVAPGNEIVVSATVEVDDPLKNRARIGDAITVDARHAKPEDLDATLSAASTELKRVLLGAASTSLRTELASERKHFYEKTGFGTEFATLSDRLFPEGHPMRGALLVGPTEPADDMFLHLEPTWALKTTITLRGAIDVDPLAESLEKAFGALFVPSKAPALVAPSRVALRDDPRDVLLGWESPPIAPERETASRVAFLLACHDRIGRFHRTLSPDKSSGERIACSLELAPEATVAWVLVLPATPFTIADAENGMEKTVANLMTEGPTDAELSAARQLLRVELAKERDTATIRGIPRAAVVADNERILGTLEAVRRDDVASAARTLFAKDHRVVVTGG